MKLLRYGQIGSEKPGVLGNDGEIRDLSGLITDIDASVLSDQALQKLRDADLSKLPVVSGKKTGLNSSGGDRQRRMLSRRVSPTPHGARVRRGASGGRDDIP